MTVNQHVPFGRFVDADQQPEKGRFAAARRADEGDRLAGPYRERRAIQHPGVVLAIAKPQATHFQAAQKRLGELCRTVEPTLRFRVHDIGEAFEVKPQHTEGEKGADQAADPAGKLSSVTLEGEKHAQGHVTVEDLEGAEVEHGETVEGLPDAET